MAASGDVSLAFLNSDMPSSELILAEPLTALKRYLLEQPGEHARTVMGYDAAPKHGASYGTILLTGKPWRQALASSKLSLYLKKSASQTKHGIVAVYDDILAVGEGPVVAAVMEFIQRTWTTTKFSGFITRGPEEALTHDGSFTMPRVQELTFIGLQIGFDEGQQVVLHQRRWILSELHKRGWVHLCRTQVCRRLS